MERSDFHRLEELYFEFETLEPEDRQQRLAVLRGEQPEFARRLERMLDSASSPTSTGLDTSQIRVRPTEDLGPGDRVGPFELRRLLGEGGMGVVFEAEQIEPVRRLVALKIVKKGLDSGAILRRFEHERQVLARLEHANVARVFEAGEAPDGRPWFAMERVDGRPIHEFCRQHELDLRQRIELLLPVCDAVQHAHRRGIVHRDLKPSNVLVHLADDDPKPQIKVIDFGIAKALQQPDDQTAWTRHGQLLGTPEYMSPEQFLGEEVDTRSDVYSLGVLLFELLVGEPPTRREQLRQHGAEAMRSLLLERDTPRPSQRLARLGPDLQATTGFRISADSLSRTLSRDLDWVVMKALALDRDQRYETPSELASELQRFLRDEPVLAGAPSLRSRAGKFLRRHRLPVLAGLALASTLLAAVVGLTVGLLRAQRAESVAQRETEVARQVLDFMQGVLAEGAREASQGQMLTTPELFDRARDRLENEPPTDPRVYGTVLTRIGEFFHMDAEQFSVAEEMFSNASEVLENESGAEKELATTQYMLGIIARMRGDLERAEALQSAAADLLVEVDGAHGESADVLGEQAMILRSRGRPEEALVLLDRAADLMRSARGPEFRETVSKEVLRTQVLDDLGRREEARQELLRLLEISRRLEYWQYVSTIHNDLGAMDYRSGDLTGAFQRFSQALEITRNQLGGDPQRLAGRLANVGVVAAKRGDYATAATLLDEALGHYLKVYGGRSPDWSATAQLLAEVRLRAGDLRAAEELLLEILPYEYEQELLRVGPFRGEANLAFALEQTGRRSAAHRRVRAALRNEPWRKKDPAGWCSLAIDAARLGPDTGTDDYAQALEECGDLKAAPSAAHARLRYHADRAELTAAVTVLEEMNPRRHVDRWLALDPLLEPLRALPEFAAFLEESTPN